MVDLEPRSIILTSGTLSPMDSFQAELGVEFNQKLENPHVIDPKQVSVAILPKGINNKQFNFSFANREDAGMYMDLGHSVARMAEITPGGILIFFPSYRILETCYEHWLNSGIAMKIDQYKLLLKEPKDSS